VTAIEIFLRNDSRASALFCTVTGGLALPDETRGKKKRALAGSPAFYRDKAEVMRKQAKAVQSPEAKAQLLKLAEHWERLAQTVEHPNW
jgi:hypothetical protein